MNNVTAVIHHIWEVMDHRPHLGPFCNDCVHFLKLKAKARDSYIARFTGKPDQPHFTIVEVALDRQEPVVLQR